MLTPHKPVLARIPVKDTRTEFVNTGYRRDTVTVTGWLKDIPENYSHVKIIELYYTDIISTKQKCIPVELDKQGRFSVKLPVLNSTEFLFSWADETILTLLDPGNDYFFFYAPQEK